MPDTVLGVGGTAKSWSVPAFGELTFCWHRLTRKSKQTYSIISGNGTCGEMKLAHEGCFLFPRFYFGFIFRSVINKNLWCHIGVLGHASPPKNLLQAHLGKSGSFSSLLRPHLHPQSRVRVLSVFVGLRVGQPL